MGKGFFTSEESASNFAQGMSKQGSGPFTTVKTEIPGDVAGRSAPYSPAAEGDALFIVDDDLPLLGAPQIQDTMKVPQ